VRLGDAAYAGRRDHDQPLIRQSVGCEMPGVSTFIRCLSDGTHVVDKQLRLKEFDVIGRDGEIYVSV
jgi:hypothetical protein